MSIRVSNPKVHATNIKVIQFADIGKATPTIRNAHIRKYLFKGGITVIIKYIITFLSVKLNH